MKRLLIILFLAPFFCGATTYYVATTGSDGANGLSLGTAWQTIGHAASGRTHGDLILVSDGTYNERVTVSASGIASIDSSGQITFRSSNLHGAHVVGGFILSGQYITVDGFDVSFPTSVANAGRDTSTGAICCNNSWQDVVNCQVHDTPTYGIWIYPGGYQGLFVQSNYVYSCGSGIQMNGMSSFSEFQYNEVYHLTNIAGDSIFNNHLDQDYMVAQGDNLLIRGNYFHGTKFSEITFRLLDAGNNPVPNASPDPSSGGSNYGDGNDFQAWDGYWRNYAHVDGCEMWGGTNVFYENNRVFNTTSLVKAEQGAGFAYSTVVARNNIGQDGDTLFSAYTVLMYNNTMFAMPNHDGIDYEQAGGSFSGSLVIAKNNIFDGADWGIYAIVSPGVCTTNLIEAGNLLYNLAGGYCSSGTNADPKFKTAPGRPYGSANNVTTYITSGTVNSLTFNASPGYSIGQVIEYCHDGISRSITGAGTTITFTPSLAAADVSQYQKQPGVMVYNWGSSLATLDTSLQTNSPALGAGVFLTTITSSNGSGTSFNVAEARYFNPGWGAGTSHPVLGDVIQLQGQTATSRITAISGKTVTLGSSLTWTNGQGVALAFSGAAPDIGAGLVVSSGTTNAPSMSAPPIFRIIGQ